MKAILLVMIFNTEMTTADLTPIEFNNMEVCIEARNQLAEFGKSVKLYIVPICLKKGKE